MDIIVSYLQKRGSCDKFLLFMILFAKFLKLRLFWLTVFFDHFDPKF